MGLRSINNSKSSFDDPYARTGLEAADAPPEPYPDGTGEWYGARGIWGGGNGAVNTIQYVTIASTSNTTDFGDLTEGRAAPGACSNGSRGCFGGGHNASDTKLNNFLINK